MHHLIVLHHLQNESYFLVLKNYFHFNGLPHTYGLSVCLGKLYTLIFSSITQKLEDSKRVGEKKNGSFSVILLMLNNSKILHFNINFQLVSLNLLKDTINYSMLTDKSSISFSTIFASCLIVGNCVQFHWTIL